MVVKYLWHTVGDYAHLEYVNEALSDHTPLILLFPSSLRKNNSNIVTCGLRITTLGGSSKNSFEKITRDLICFDS